VRWWRRWQTWAVVLAVAFVVIAVDAIAMFAARLGDIDVLSPPAPLAHRPSQPASVCLLLRAVRADAVTTWSATEPLLGAPPSSDTSARLVELRLRLIEFQATVRAAEVVARRTVRDQLELTRQQIVSGARDTHRPFAEWRDRTWGAAALGYSGLQGASDALGDACGFRLDPLLDADA
jgi:hypothetical protein